MRDLELDDGCSATHVGNAWSIANQLIEVHDVRGAQADVLATRVTAVGGEVAMSVQVIGVDCATQPEKVGLARGIAGDNKVRVLQARIAGRHTKVEDVLAEWIRAHDGPTLLALDAPLGWPIGMRKALATHEAGTELVVDAEPMFRRATDLAIEGELGKRSLDVGANLIARTAHSAVDLL